MTNLKNKNTRTIALVGQDNFEKLSQVKIGVVGIGGVGGAATEAIYRAGISNLRLIDFDVYDVTNLNRQLGANLSNIGKSKVESFKDRLLDIDKDGFIDAVQTKLCNDNLEALLGDRDYILDMCDDVEAKCAIMKFAYEKQKFLISAMGAGKRLDVSKLTVTTLDKTRYCQLAKKLRKIVPKNIASKTKVLFYDSELSEMKVDTNMIGTISYSPNYMGFRAAEVVIRDILEV